MQRRGVIQNSILLGASSAIGAAFALLATVHIGRAAGVEGFGILSLSRTMAEFSITIASLGITVVSARRIARGPRLSQLLVGAVVTWRFTVSIVCVLGMWAYSRYVGSVALEQTVLILGVSVLGSAFLVDWLYAARENLLLPSLARLTARVAYTVLIIALVSDPNDIPIAAWIVSIECLATVFFLLVGYPGGWRVKELRRGPRLLPSLLRESVPIAAGQLARQIKTNIDVLMLGALSTATAVGLYSAAYRIVMFVYMLAGVYATALLPRIARANQKDGEHSKAVSAAIRMTCLIGLWMIAVGAPVSPVVVTTLFGQEFSASAAIMPILVSASGLLVVSMALGNLAIALDRNRTFVVACSVAAGLNVSLNLYAIPNHGFTGAAWVTLVTELVLTLILLVALRDQGVGHAFAGFWAVRAFLAAALAWAAIAAAQTVLHSVILLSVLGTLVLFVTGWLAGISSPRELKSIANDLK